MQESQFHSNKKERSSLLQKCRKLISDQAVQLQKIDVQNVSLKASVQQYIQKQEMMSKEIMALKQKIQVLESNAIRQRKQNEAKIKEMQMQMVIMMQDGYLAKETSQKFEKNQNSLAQLNKNLTLENQSVKRELKSLQKQYEQETNSLNETLQELREQLRQSKNQHKNQKQKLKDINIVLQSKLQHIEEQYRVLLEQNEEQPSRFSLSRQFQKIKINRSKAQSIEKRSVSRGRQKTSRIIRTSNPQKLGQQLLDIKKTIADSCGRIQNTREQVMMSRVNKTLNNISSLLQQVSGHIESSID